MLIAALKALEPATPGRPSRAPSPEQVQIDELKEQLRHKELELQAARVREELALVLPHVNADPPEGEKKRRGPSRRRSRPGRKKNT
jgi:hypothetical protein